MMATINVRINGIAHSPIVENRTLLVDLLRDQLELTGTHVGCDTSQCGACLVRVDGNLVKACTMLAVEVDGSQLVTIEGIGNADGTLGPVQAAFKTHHGLQCGFCTPGMVMAATSLLEENPKPTPKDIRAYLEGNLCRCTGYQNIVRAVLAASGQNPDLMMDE